MVAVVAAPLIAVPVLTGDVRIDWHGLSDM
jgi:hypothetical protein